MTLWASYQLDKLLLAVEFATDEKNAVAAAPTILDYDVDAFMIMGNYSVTDSFAITARYSQADYTYGSDSIDVDKFTISPSYSFTDNFSGLIEYSTYDVTTGNTEPDDLTAVELIYTF